MCQARLDTPPRPNRPRSCADIAPDRDVATHRERAHGVLRVEHDHKVGDVRPNLEAPSETPCGDARGGGPGAVGEAGDDEAGAGFAGEHEACLDDLEDGEAWGGASEDEDEGRVGGRTSRML